MFFGRAVFRRAIKRTLRHTVAGLGMLTGQNTGALPRVLCYHGVCDRPQDEWSVTPAQLREHMRLLVERCCPVSLQQIVAWVHKRATLPPQAVAVTFDDGFVDVLLRAGPILGEFNVPGAAFIAPGLASAGERAADPSFAVNRPLMGWRQIKELHQAGWTIGSHSLTHPRLATLPDEVVRRELEGSRRALEDQLGCGIDLLAYPYGTAQTVSMRDQRLAAQAGYQAAFLDMTGPIRQGDDPLALSRSKVLGTDSPLVVLASLTGAVDLWRLIEGRH